MIPLKRFSAHRTFLFPRTGDLHQDLQHPFGSFAARDALPQLSAAEIHEKFCGVHHAVVLIHQDQTARNRSGSGVHAVFHSPDEDPESVPEDRRRKAADLQSLGISFRSGFTPPPFPPDRRRRVPNGTSRRPLRVTFPERRNNLVPLERFRPDGANHSFPHG